MSSLFSQIRPKKELGQVFLKEEKILKEIAEQLEIEEDDNILEIGAGIGNLSQFLAKNLKRGSLFLLEKDERFRPFLEKIKLDYKGKKIFLLFEDLRNIDLNELVFSYKPIKIVANLPYYLSGFFLRKILDLESYPALMVLMLQKEVGDKFLSKKSNFFSVAFGVISEVKKIKVVKAGSFSPPPKVDSMLLKFEFKDNKDLPSYSIRKEFFSFLSKVFFKPNRKLYSSLVKQGFSKEKIKKFFVSQKISFDVRPLHLKPEQLLELFLALKK